MGKHPRWYHRLNVLPARDGDRVIADCWYLCQYPPQLRGFDITFGTKSPRDRFYDLWHLRMPLCKNVFWFAGEDTQCFCDVVIILKTTLWQRDFTKCKNYIFIYKYVGDICISTCAKCPYDLISADLISWKELNGSVWFIHSYRS